MNTLDLLLKLDESKIKKPTKQVEIRRLSEALGEKVIFTCQAVTANKMAEIQEMVLDVKTQQIDVQEMQIMTVLAGVKEPNLKDKKLLEKFNAPTPKELLQKLLLSGEITNLYNVISELSGYGPNSVAEIKN